MKSIKSLLPALLTVLVLLVCNIALLVFSPVTYKMKSAGNVQLPLRCNDRKREIPIFYNLFIKQQEDISRIKGYFQEQSAITLPIHRMIVSLIAEFDLPKDFFPADSSHVMIDHVESGSELVSLHKVWEHCQLVSDDQAFDSLVVYLHDKGSLHPNRRNDLMRQRITKGALSEACANLPDTCNVCSMRFSPLPFPHVSGNMWLARCSYVKKLIAPSTFSKKMDSFRGKGNGWGKQRFALEAYIHYHNDARPCDVLPDNINYTWSYSDNASLFDDEPQIKAAPCLPYEEFMKEINKNRMTAKDCALNAPDRLDVHNHIEGSFSEPPVDWWGYDFYPNAREQVKDWIHNHTSKSTDVLL